MQIVAMLISIFFFLALPGAAEAQENDESVAETTEQDELDARPDEQQADEQEANVAEAEEEDIIVDDEYYQDADDADFRPSEDIPADQSIPFPTDI